MSFLRPSRSFAQPTIHLEMDQLYNSRTKFLLLYGIKQDSNTGNECHRTEDRFTTQLVWTNYHLQNKNAKWLHPHFPHAVNRTRQPLNDLACRQTAPLVIRK